MKILKIEDGKSLYSFDDLEFHPITSIDKDAIKKILNLVYSLENDEFSFDHETDENKIFNEAEKIIHNNLLSKFQDFISKKEEIQKEIDDEFKEVREKYFNNI